MAFNSFYLSDLENIIDRVALDAMIPPQMTYEKPGSNVSGATYTLAEVSNYNSLVAANNEGVRDFAMRLKEELKEMSQNDS